MSRRTTGFIVLAIGFGLVVYTYAIDLFSASDSFDTLSADVAPLMQDASIDQLRQDLEGLKVVSAEFGTKGVPTLAQALGRTPEEVQSLFAARFPETARGLATLPTIVTSLETQVELLDAQNERFARVNSIPYGDESTTRVPWTILIWGIAAILVGALMITGTRGMPTAAVLVGISMIAVTVAFSLPGKSADADRLNDAFRPVFTTEQVAELRTAQATLSGMATELGTSMVPVLAEQLNVPEPEAQAFVAREFPVTFGALPQIPAAIARLGNTADVIDANIGAYETAAGVTYQPIPWVIVTTGAIIILLGVWTARTRPTAERHALERMTRRMRKAA